MEKLLRLTLFPVLLLFPASLTYSGCGATQKSPQEFFESGQNYREQGLHREAVIQFLNTLQDDPQHRDARYFLARSYLQLKNWARAEQELKTLLESFPEDTEAGLTLGNLYLTAAQANPEFVQKAQEIAEEITAREPENVEALILSGNAAAGMRDYTSSLELLEQALELDQENLTAALILGAIEAVQQNFPEAEQAFLRARELAPTSKSVLLSLGLFYESTGERDQAEAVLEEAFATHPTDRQVYTTWVRFQLLKGEIESAQQVLRDVQQQMPDDPSPSLLLVDLYLAQDYQTETKALMADLQEQFPESLAVAKKRVRIDWASDPEGARVEAEQIVSDAPQDSEAWMLLGELEFSLGNYDKAQAVFEQPVLTNGPYPEPHFFRARIAEFQGKDEVAIQGYQDALRISPNYLPARLALAQSYFQKGLYTESSIEVGEVLEVRPDHLDSRLLKVRLSLVAGEIVQAEKELTALLELYPDKVSVHRLAGMLFQSRNRNGQAETHFRKALQLEPSSPEVLNDLVQLYLKTDQTQRAIESIQVQVQEKEAPIHHDLLGQIYLESGRYQEATYAFRRAIELDNTRVGSYISLSSTFFQSGQTQEGLAWIDKLLEKSPTYALAHSLKGYIYLRQGDLPTATEHYQKALELDPEDPDAANHLAYVLGEQNRDLQVAQRWAQTARRLEPENPDFADTLGWIYYKLGMYVLARDQLRFATVGKPDDPLLQYHLGMTLWKGGQPQEALGALQKALESEAFQERDQAQTALDEIMKESQKAS